MRGARTTEQALRLARSPLSPSRPFVCPSCRKHQARQLHTTPALLADSSQPWWKKLSDSIFSDKGKAAKATEARALANKQKALQSERKTVTALDGTVYEYARQYDSEVNEDYEPAMSWKGLERVGSASWVKQRLDQGEQYKGHRSSTKRLQLNADQWWKVLHHVTVEALSLKKHNIPLADLYQEKRAGKHSGAWEASSQAKVQGDRLGNITVSFRDPAHEQTIIDNAGKGSIQELMADSGSPKLSLFVPIKDPLVKFAIAQRVQQWTGHRLSDSSISSVKNLHDFCNAYQKQEPAKKLALEPKVQQMRSELPNVTWHKEKQTMVHKEQAVGRWKIIAAELAKRDLPTTGTRWKQARTFIQ